MNSDVRRPALCVMQPTGRSGDDASDRIERRRVKRYHDLAPVDADAASAAGPDGIGRIDRGIDAVSQQKCVRSRPKLVVTGGVTVRVDGHAIDGRCLIFLAASAS